MKQLSKAFDEIGVNFFSFLIAMALMINDSITNNLALDVIAMVIFVLGVDGAKRPFLKTFSIVVAIAIDAVLLMNLYSHHSINWFSLIAYGIVLVVLIYQVFDAIRTDIFNRKKK